MRILLAEDDELLGSGIRAGLAQNGFQVDWVRDGVAAERDEMGRCKGCVVVIEVLFSGVTASAS